MVDSFGVSLSTHPTPKEIRVSYGDLCPYRWVLISALNACYISCGAHPEVLGESYFCRYENLELAANPDPEYP